ncbi:MAG: N-methyltryptophan oxidase [Verrucomicrobia bacterium]|nr:N-methyltryptophan oxidase [Verrucomicrobiota bacterium]
MTDTYDVIVAGVGGMGSSALFHLAQDGLKVCGIEQFEPGHSRGSSHGDSRIIRKAYFLDPSYVPLMHRSYELMAELERRRNVTLFHNVGLITAGVIGSEFHRGMEKCFATHDLPHACWTVDEARVRYPHFNLPDDSIVYFDPAGGFGNPEAFVKAHTASALEEGATLLPDERMISWQADANGVEVRTDKRRLRAAKLVLTTGAWIIPELRKLGASMTLKRKVQVWFEMADISLFRPEVCPVFILKNRGGDFYGFPTLDGRTVKTAETSGGTPLDSADEQHDKLLPSDLQNLSQFMRNTFGSLAGRAVAHQACLQTFTNDQNFIIDHHPETPRVILCSPCSGHGFKFTPVIGEVLSHLIQGRTPAQDISLFRLNRFPALS